MRSMHRLVLTGLVLAAPAALLFACGDSAETGDAGADGGGADAGRVDVRADAVGRADTGAQDSDVDTGRADAGDSGLSGDGGDAGASTDGGGPDGGDAGPAVSFMVVRVGAGGDAGALGAAAAPVFLEERRSSDGFLARTIPLPVAASGNNQPVTLAGNSQTEGALTRSANGSYVVLAGYAAVPGTASINGTQSGTVNRVVARIDKNGVVDSSTRLDAAFSTVSVRGAATDTGASFWVSGENGAMSTGGVYHVSLGTQGGTQILAAPQNMRTVGVFGGQLFGSTQSTAGGNTLRLFAIGTGLPTMAGQTGTNLPGITTMTTAPHGFVLLDLNNQVAGVDTLYVADTSSLMTGGGIQKWTFNGTTWTLMTTFKTGLTAAPVAVTAAQVGTTVHVLCTTLDSPAKVVLFVDDGSMNPTGTTLTTAQPNTVFRGIALSPQ